MTKWINLLCFGPKHVLKIMSSYFSHKVSYTYNSTLKHDDWKLNWYLIAILPHFFLDFICFKGQVTEKWRERERERELSILPSAGLLPKWPQWPALSQAKARDQQLHPRLPWGWQGSDNLTYLLLLSQVHQQGSGSEAEKQTLYLAVSYMGCWPCNCRLSMLHHKANQCIQIVRIILQIEEIW